MVEAFMLDMTIEEGHIDPIAVAIHAPPYHLR
jgi:hypothetical protein